VQADRSEGGKFEVKAANTAFGELSAKTEVARTPSVVSRSKAGVTIRVKKKLQGILVSFSGDEALVMFDNKGESVEPKNSTGGTWCSFASRIPTKTMGTTFCRF